jgi:ABC-type Fe3+-hydroxamate transport system substrate-binding protein
MWIKTTDQAGFEVVIERVPKRIISIVPSQTELLNDLGLEDEVVGITKFCVHPEQWFRTKARVGGTKNVHIDRVRALIPDLILANKEENTMADVEALREICPVWTSDIKDVSDAIDMIQAIGQLVNRTERSDVMVQKILTGIANIKKVKKRVAYLIWKKPYMAAGGDTFIHAMMEACGWENAFAQLPRYPAVSMQDLVSAEVELLLLSSEPYPFKMNDIEELNEVLIDTKILLVDGEMFSWYGSRMLQFTDYVRKL